MQGEIPAEGGHFDRSRRIANNEQKNLRLSSSTFTSPTLNGGRRTSMNILIEQKL